MRTLALTIAAVCVAPLIAFAVLWSGILAALAVMWLWYSGTFIPVSFLMMGYGMYLYSKRHRQVRFHPAHAAH